MFREFELTFSPECCDYVKKAYECANVIVEYGSGGSTLWAAKNNKHVITVESDSAWLMELMGAYKEQKLAGDIIPLWADIGKTKEWGYPLDDSMWAKWPQYSSIPWRYCNEHALVPDLVLIDGRFRVACFLASCIHINVPTTILVDDFVEREEYHVLKELAEPVDIIGERMAVFKLVPGMIDTKFLLEKMAYFYTSE